MKLCDIVRKTRQELEFDFDGSHVSYPEKDSRFLKFDREIASVVASRKMLVQRMTERGLGSQIADAGPFEFCRSAVAGEAPRLDYLIYGSCGVVAVKQCLQLLNQSILDLLQGCFLEFLEDQSCFIGDSAMGFAHFTHLPDQVVNGYWIYTDSLRKNTSQNAHTSFRFRHYRFCDCQRLSPSPCRVDGTDFGEKVIYIPPNAVKMLNLIQKPGSLHFQASFFVDPDTQVLYKKLDSSKNLISGLVELNPRKTATSGVCGEPFTAACRHGQGKNGNWLCSTCGDVVCSSGGQVGCQNCGCADLEDLTFHCFCTEGLQYSDKSSFSAAPLDASPTTPSTGGLQTAEVLEISGETFETTLRKIIDKFEQLLQDFDDF